MNTPLVTPQTPVISARADALREAFSWLEDWEARYAHILDLGRALVPLTEAEKSETNRVRGCASQVWLVADPLATAGQGTRWRGDSDALLVRGLVALVLELYSGAPETEVRAFDAGAFLAELGVAGALSPQRANGLASMVARIRAAAS
jgi:cysteine desulfuration protein SufE